MKWKEIREVQEQIESLEKEKEKLKVRKTEIAQEIEDNKEILREMFDDFITKTAEGHDYLVVEMPLESLKNIDKKEWKYWKECSQTSLASDISPDEFLNLSIVKYYFEPNIKKVTTHVIFKNTLMSDSEDFWLGFNPEEIKLWYKKITSGKLSTKDKEKELKANIIVEGVKLPLVSAPDLLKEPTEFDKKYPTSYWRVVSKHIPKKLKEQLEAKIPTNPIGWQNRLREFYGFPDIEANLPKELYYAEIEYDNGQVVPVQLIWGTSFILDPYDCRDDEYYEMHAEIIRRK